MRIHPILFTSFLMLLAILMTDDCVCRENGITVGYNHSYFGGYHRYDFGDHDSFTGGIFSSFAISDILSFEMGLQYERLGADGEGTIFYDSDIGRRMITTEAIHRIDYLTIPLKVRASSPFRLGTLVPSLAVGLTPSVNLSATSEFTPSNPYTRALFEVYNFPFNRDIENVRSIDLSFALAAALEKRFSGATMRIQAEWSVGLTNPFKDYKCNSPTTCDDIYGLFNYDIYSSEIPAVMLHNRSFMLTVSLIP